MMQRRLDPLILSNLSDTHFKRFASPVRSFLLPIRLESVTETASPLGFISTHERDVFVVPGAHSQHTGGNTCLHVSLSNVKMLERNVFEPKIAVQNELFGYNPLNGHERPSGFNISQTNFRLFSCIPLFISRLN